jgi:hypothetical protein
MSVPLPVLFSYALLTLWFAGSSLIQSRQHHQPLLFLFANVALMALLWPALLIWFGLYSAARQSYDIWRSVL